MAANRTTTKTKAKKHGAKATLLTSHKRARKARPCKQIFAGMVMSFAGDFLEARNSKSWTIDAMVRWVTNHGAKYVKEVNQETTHLICTIKAYKAKCKQVRKAWERGRHCHIVVSDWLEDCLQGVKGKVSKRHEKPYTLNRVLARVAKGKTDQIRFRQRFEEGVRASKELVDDRLHMVEVDNSGFEYKIVLTRINLGGRNMIEKYTIYFFKSIAKPHTYMTGAKFSRSHRPTTYWREECHVKQYEDAFRDFKHIFEQKTQVPWDQRLEGLRKGPEAFVYTPPKLGRPVGALPLGYVRPELRVDKWTLDSSGEESSPTESSGGGSSSSEDERRGEEGLVYDTDSDAEDSEDETATQRTHTTRSSSSGRSRDIAIVAESYVDGGAAVAGRASQDSGYGSGSQTMPIVLSDSDSDSDSDSE